MSGGKYIKQAVIASLCEHPDAEKYRQRAFSAGNIEQVMEALAQSQTLTKADFLTPDDDGKFIIDSTAAWKNFDKIVKAVQDNGDKFTFEDFMSPLSPNQPRTLLESARIYGGLSKVFAVDVWRGRYEEMERLWYKVPVPNRKDVFRNNGLISADLKRAMYAADGRITPEDRLERAGLTPFDVRQAFTERGNFEDVSRRLQQAGDYFRKEYLLLTDSSGDTVFDNRAAAWSKYDAAVRALSAHGERLEVDDFVRKVAFAKDILSRAGEHKTLNKIFTPAHWADRLPDMLQLWSHVKDGWKMAPMTTYDFDNAYAEAESLTFTKCFEARPVTGKADLLAPLNEGAEKPVLPLGLRAVWDKLDVIQVQLAKQGEALTLSDLRAVSGEMGNTCLMGAVKFGAFDKVASLSRNGDQLMLADFLSKDRHGNTLISILVEKKQLSLVFTPQIWTGRINEMKTLWAQVAINQRHQVDFQQAEISVKQATLKLKKGGIKLQPPGQKGTG